MVAKKIKTKAIRRSEYKTYLKKSTIEYEDRDFTQKEALEILKLTDRFYSWVVSNIG